MHSARRVLKYTFRPINSGSERCFSATTATSVRYGFIGLGRMGFPMATNLKAKIQQSDKLIIHDVNKDAVTKFQQVNRDVEIVDTVADVANKSDVIITVLPEPDHVRQVYKSILEGLAEDRDGQSRNRLFIDCSTIDPSTSAEVAASITESGNDNFIDAPMSGGVVAAQSGQLTFMIGADKNLVDKASKILSTMGRRVLHLGPQTSGLKGKLANNYLLAINNVATAEAMNMGIKWGLDPTALAGMINISTGKCWPSEVNNPVPGVISTAPSSREYAGGFGTSLMAKDLKLAMKAASEVAIETKLGPVAKELYAQVEGEPSLKGKDFSIVYKLLSMKT